MRVATVTNDGSRYSGGDEHQTISSHIRMNVARPSNGRLTLSIAVWVEPGAGTVLLPLREDRGSADIHLGPGIEDRLNARDVGAHAVERCNGVAISDSGND